MQSLAPAETIARNLKVSFHGTDIQELVDGIHVARTPTGYRVDLPEAHREAAYRIAVLILRSFANDPTTGDPAITVTARQISITISR